MPTEFGSLIPGLNSQQFDVVAAGMYINPERCEQVIFADPDYQMLDSFIVPQGQSEGPARLQGHRREEGEVRDGHRLRGDRVRRRGGVQGERHPDRPGPGRRTERRRGRAASTSSPARRSPPARWSKNSAKAEATKAFAPLVDGKPHVDGGAFAFRPTETKLRDAFNVELHKLKKSGELFRDPAAVRLHQGRDDGPHREGAVRRMTSGLWELVLKGIWITVQLLVFSAAAGRRGRLRGRRRPHPPAVDRPLPRRASTPRCSAAPPRWS